MHESDPNQLSSSPCCRGSDQILAIGLSMHACFMQVAIQVAIVESRGDCESLLVDVISGIRGINGLQACMTVGT
jgi:hypothetical protein